MTNTTTNTKVLNVKNIIVANTLRENLIDIIRSNKEEWYNKSANEMEKNTHCLQCKAIWTTIALLENLLPDTYEGDMKMMELWDSCGLGNQLDENEFDLFMWYNLT